MWEGIITRVQDGGFSVIVFDLNSLNFEIGEFPLDAISTEDGELVKTGAVFTWSPETGFEFKRDGKMSEKEFQKRLEAIKHIEN